LPPHNQGVHPVITSSRRRMMPWTFGNCIGVIARA
jgi:hypothetical protein